MLNIPVDDKALQAVVQQAIFQAITPESQSVLVRQAIENMLKIESNSYDKKSLLQRAFDNAVSVVVHQVVKDLIEKDSEVNAKIKELISASLIHLVTNNKQLVENLSEAIAKAFVVKERY